MQKLYLRVPEALYVRMMERCDGSRMPIFRLFEEAIDLAYIRRVRFWQVAAASIPKRKKGRRLGTKTDEFEKVGTQVSPAHYERLKTLCAEPKRFKSDVLTAALTFYLGQRERAPSTAAVAMELLLYPSFPAQSVSLPKAIGEVAPRPDSIKAGSTVLIDAWVLLCGTSTIVRGSVCSYLSEQCWRLLQRCRSGEVVGIISTLDVLMFQRLLSKFGHRAQANGQTWSIAAEVVRRMYAVTHCGLWVMPLTPEHVRAGVTEINEEKSNASISIACAHAHSPRFVVATLGWNFDEWANRFPVYKASDAGTSPAIPPECVEEGALNRERPDYVKASIESEYARIMAEHGRAVPSKYQALCDKAAPRQPEPPREVKPAHIPGFLWSMQRPIQKSLGPMGEGEPPAVTESFHAAPSEEVSRA